MSFYMYDYDSIPSTPPIGMWYASWSMAAPEVVWSQTRPTTVPDGKSSWVIGVADQEFAPTGAVALSGGGSKQLPPLASLSATSVPTFQSAFNDWVVAQRDHDLTE